MSAIRQLLEEIWQSRSVICANHIVWWNRDHGHRMTGPLADALYAAKGKRVNPDNPAKKQQKKRLEHP